MTFFQLLCGVSTALAGARESRIRFFFDMLNRAADGECSIAFCL
jgi:hypothetical protein